MAESVYTYDPATPGNNGAASDNVAAAEGQAPGSVNNGMRGLMGELIAWILALGGAAAAYGGSSNAYTITNEALGNWSSYTDGQLIALDANHTNTGAATVNVDAIGAKAIVTPDGGALAAGDLVSGGRYLLSYDAGNDRFQVMSTLAGGDFQARNTNLTGLSAVTFSAANAFLRATGAGAFVTESAASHRSNMGLGSMCTQNENAISVSGGSMTNVAIEQSGQNISMGTIGSAGELRMRSGFAVNSSGGSGLGELDHSGSFTDGLGVYGHDGITLLTGQTARVTTILGVQIGAPTGGDKGAGTLNCVAAYDDNSLLSCFVFDAALDGSVDLAKWDEKVPDRRHPARFASFDTGEIDDDGEAIFESRMVAEAYTETRQHDPARWFARRLGTDYDPLTLDGYSRHWKEKRHLTSMPNEAKFDPVAGMPTGAWIQRLVEDAEIKAVLIDQLHALVKAQGARIAQLEADRSSRT